MDFRRIVDLPPYVFTIIDALKVAARRSGVDLDPDTEVITTIGAKEGFSHSMWVLLVHDNAYAVEPYSMTNRSPWRAGG